jgi:predicted enzyme related to lactoylglutathione lyase
LEDGGIFSRNGLLDDHHSGRYGWRYDETPATDQKIVDYFDVFSVLESSAKVEKLGGKILVPKTPIPKMGYFAVCIDTEGNVFGLYENDPKAK